MKWFKIFALFVVLHAVGWSGAHWYLRNNPSTVLIVADTSFSLKQHFVDMQSWIDDYAKQARYQQILIGTDKAYIGELAEIKSRDSIFRVAFGRSSEESLRRFSSLDTKQRILLSDGSFNPPGWDTVTFR